MAYECEGESGPAALVVRHAAGLVRSTVSWSEGGKELRVPTAAVDAYPAARRSRYNALTRWTRSAPPASAPPR
ncbi:MAG: hypothetical protein HY721_21515 [Planctomycetes bacterium]|nr:hypothetical protein [Planctomycetota bacterium]